MLKHLWVERGMLSGLTKKTCILVIVILSSILATGHSAGYVCWRSLAGEGKHGRRSGDDWRLLLPPGPEILPVS